MVPSEIYGDDLWSVLIRYSLFVSTVFQLICLYLCLMLPDQQREPHQFEKANTDSDECSSEQSSPGHRVIMRGRRHDKKKRR